ncbi:nucleoside monophosphate kinase [Puniceicoccales bacterium CK1056]|uniref:Adenylate kinase n=1 Tax=Oceanipulchritudo coccoides TaxID=2706888 RepID=A0A6B2M2J3_9BACT|nr:nucleoside monophosphate kinase [Oceanipulchritudo coccoides]NDV63168.1 nucleoside monophosphate kinase [Oceanipulchritudo coccoides]
MSDKALENPKEQAAKRTLDLEIKDAQLIFNSVWSELLEELGEEKLVFPREIFWLNGAPGAGKGTQTQFIMEYCGLTAKPIVISDLLDSPEARRLKDAGMMVGDREVTSLLLKELLAPRNATGVVVDGFPRTKVQVECLKLFYQRLSSLRSKFLGTSMESDFHRPNFHIIVLYVEEAVSVNRQLERGRKVLEHNEQVRSTGSGNLEETRKTDLSVEAARNRYRTFKEITYESLTSLRQIFHYHFINAQRSVEEVQASIVGELKYQSSLELDQVTNDLISRIPVAPDIVIHARQDLVERLEQYTKRHLQLFEQIVLLIDEKFMPIVLRHAVSGRAYINSEDTVFDDSQALAIAIDVFSERGYHAAVDIRQEEVPDRIDLQTGKIFTRRKRVYRFSIHFQGSVIRRGN